MPQVFYTLINIIVRSPRSPAQNLQHIYGGDREQICLWQSELRRAQFSRPRTWLIELSKVTMTKGCLLALVQTVEDEKVMVEEANCYLLKVTAIKASLT
jgi:hypothetical protein